MKLDLLHAGAVANDKGKEPMPEELQSDGEDNDKENGEEGDDGEEEEEDEAANEEDSDDMQLAWEMLEMAKVIYNKQSSPPGPELAGDWTLVDLFIACLASMHARLTLAGKSWS